MIFVLRCTLHNRLIYGNLYPDLRDALMSEKAAQISGSKPRPMYRVRGYDTNEPGLVATALL